MATRTRASLREAVGNNLGALYPTRPTVYAADSCALPADQAFDKAGSHIYYNGQVVQITEVFNNETPGNLMIEPQFVAGFTVGDEVELWSPRYSPVTINNYINQAMVEAIERVYESADPIYACVTPRNRFVELASDISMVTAVHRRRSLDYAHSLPLPTLGREHGSHQHFT